jgi:glyoxylase-like metal-dependent hydrolase (beta-lactamase superfamily II)
MNRRMFVATPLAAISLPAFQSKATGAPTHIDFADHKPASGSFPKRWICGSESCMDNQDPPIQIHWYNDHTAILRQNKAYSYEAPFMYLYFGNDRILFLDQGFTQLHTEWDLRKAVDDCIEKWCLRYHRKPIDMELLLGFSHLHSDHWAAMNQFADRPNTRMMGLTHEEMLGFWGMKNYPEERVKLDLGGREVWIWGSPGHVMSEFAYYDTYTQILFTGDMFYRGRCYISFWDHWFASMKRLMDFIDDYPVSHVVGCHVEISAKGEDYPYGVTYQPDEAPVQLTVGDLRRAFDVAKTVKGPGIYFTGAVFLCNQTRAATTIDRNPYAY